MRGRATGLEEKKRGLTRLRPHCGEGRVLHFGLETGETFRSVFALLREYRDMNGPSGRVPLSFPTTPTQWVQVKRRAFESRTLNLGERLLPQPRKVTIQCKKERDAKDLDICNMGTAIFCYHSFCSELPTFNRTRSANTNHVVMILSIIPKVSRRSVKAHSEDEMVVQYVTSALSDYY